MVFSNILNGFAIVRDSFFLAYYLALRLIVTTMRSPSLIRHL